MLGGGNTRARRHVRHLAFIGQLNESLTEYQEFIVRRGCEEAVAVAIAEHISGEMRKEWEVLYFSVIREGSATMECFASELERRGLAPSKLFPQMSPKVSLEGSWDDFLSRMSRNSRKKVKRAEKRFDREFEHELVVAGCRAWA